MGPFYGMRLFDALLTLPIQRGRMTVGQCREGLERSRRAHLRAHLKWGDAHTPQGRYHLRMVTKYEVALRIMRHWPDCVRIFKATEDLMFYDRRATDALLGEDDPS